jgi:hypothetical protein
MADETTTCSVLSNYVRMVKKFHRNVADTLRNFKKQAMKMANQVASHVSNAH